MIKQKLRIIANRNVPLSIHNFVKLSHSGFTQDWYIVDNTENITVDTQEYMAVDFGIKLGSKASGEGATIGISNIDKLISQEIYKALEVNPNENIILEVFRATCEVNGGITTTKIQTENSIWQLFNPTITREIVSGTIGKRNSLDVNAGSKTFNQEDFSNIYLRSG